MKGLVGYGRVEWPGVEPSIYTSESHIRRSSHDKHKRARLFDNRLFSPLYVYSKGNYNYFMIPSH
jgi:hypothetical protein